MGIVWDKISVPHTLHFCQPVPTDSWKKDAVPGLINCGKSDRDLLDFPYHDEPSGGNSGRISPSEMILAYLRIDNYPGSGFITFEWFRQPHWNKPFYTFTLPVPVKANPSWTWWYWWAYSFVGHFAGEIDKAGTYGVMIKTTWGDAFIDFEIKDSRIDKQKLEQLEAAVSKMGAQVYELEKKYNDMGRLYDEKIMQLESVNQAQEKQIAEAQKGIGDLWKWLKSLPDKVVTWVIDKFIYIIEKVLDMEMKE